MHKLIHELISNKEYKSIALKIGGSMGDDLWQEFMLMICSKDEAYLDNLAEGKYFKFWAVRSLSNMMSKTGSVGKKYRLYDICIEINEAHLKEDNSYNHEIDILYPQVIDALNSELFSNYERKLLNKYIELNQNVSELHRITNIPRRSIYNSIKVIKIKLKDKFKICI
jgi:hypothetical protein